MVQATEVGESFALGHAVAELPADRERFLEVRPCLRQPTRFAQHHGNLVEDTRLLDAVAELALDGQGLVVVRPPLLDASLVDMQATQIGQDAALGASIAELALQGQCGLGLHERFVHPALVAQQVTEVAAGDGFEPPIPDLPREHERLVQQRLRLPQLPRTLQRAGAGQESPRTLRSFQIREAEHLRAQRRRDSERPLQIQHLPGRPVGRDRRLAIAARHRPPAGRDDVVELERQRTTAPSAVAPVQRLDRSVGAERRDASPVAFLGGAQGGSAARAQLLARVLVDADVHPEVEFVEVVAALGSRNPGAQQALVHEGLDGIHRRRRLGPCGQVDHLLGQLEREAALEHRALGQRRLLPRQRAGPTTSRSRP